MAKARKARRLSTPGRGRARSFAAVPLSRLTAAEERLALKFDALVTDAGVKDRQIKAMQPGIIAAKVRGGSMSVGKAFTDFGHLAGVKWPDTLYIPRDQQASSHPKPPDSRLYSHAWTGGNGVATASRDSGGLFAYAAASTIDAVKSSDAAVGITYAPASRLSYVRFEPDIYCSMAYRMFVDFWPQLVAGQVRVGSSVITGQWRRDPVAGSYELLRWNEVPVFDSLAQDAGSNVFPNIRHTLQRNFVNAALGTTFLVEGGRTYVFGVVARAWVWHNVTSNTGKPIPQDATRFRLYSEMVCSVPFMALSVQTVLVP
ncbi:MAG: hypothetical protein ABI603_00930 [Acidobacteriota bacterium]